MDWLAMLFFGLIIVLLIGGLFAALGVRGPWPSVLWFLLLLFVGTLAIGVWSQPIGPQPWGAPVLNFLIAAILLALLLAAATPDYRHGYRRPKEQPLERDTGIEPRPNVPPGEEPETVGAAAALGVFFWVFLVVAGTVLLLRLLFGP